MAMEADKVVVVLEAQTQAFNAAAKDSARTFEQATSTIEKSANRAEQAVVGSTRRSQNATRNLARQFQDVGVQLGAGTSMFVTLSQQLPQIADAVADTEGRFAGFARFLMNPWVAAGLAAASALTPFIAKAFEAGESIDKLVGKMKAQAKQAELNERADAAWKRTIDGLTQSIRKRYEEQQKALLTDRQAMQQSLDSARSEVAQAEKELKKREDRLAVLYKRLRDFENSPSGKDVRGGGTGVIAELKKEIERLERERILLVEDVIKGQNTVRGAEAEIGERDVAGRLDAVTAATNAYTDALGNLRRERQKGLISQAEFEKKLAEEGRKRDAAVKAAQAAERAANSTAEPRVTPGDVGGVLKGAFGGTITSTNGGKHVPGSYHYRNQAVDFVPKGGVHSVTKQQIREALGAEGISIVELLGPGDKGHSDHFHVAFGKSRGSKDAHAQKQERQAEQLADRRASNERQFQDKLSAFNVAIADARRKQAQTAEEELAAQIQAIDARTADRAQEIDRLRDKAVAEDAANKAEYDFNAAMAHAKNQILAQAEKEAARADTDQRLDLDKLRLAQGVLRDQEEVLQAQADLAKTGAQRRDLELQIIDAQKEIAKNAVEQAFINKQITEAERDRQLAQIDTIAGLKKKRVEDTPATPFERYYDSLNLTPEQIRERAEQAAVDELQYLRDGLVDGLTEELGIKDPLIRQLVGMFIDQVIMRPIAEALANAQNGGGGIFGAITGAIGGLFGGGSTSGPGYGGGLPAFAGGGSIMVNGRGGLDQNVLSINGQKVARVNQGEIIDIVPANARAARGGGVTVISAPRFDLSRAVVTPDLYRDMQRISDESAARAGAAAYNRSIRDAPAAVRQANRFGNR